MPDSEDNSNNSAAATHAAATALLVTKSGLRLRICRLSSREASRYQWIALLPYSWTNDQTARRIGHGWPVLATSAAAAAAAAAASWRRCGSGKWWLVPPLCLAILLPEAVRRSLQLLLWLFSTRRLPDYDNFASFWAAGQNRLYGAFAAAVESEDAAAADGQSDGAAEQQQQQIVGTIASLHINGSTCEMQRLGVPERWRDRGIGDALCRFLVADCASRGYRWMQLGTSRLQEPAVRIYERLGFTRVAQRRYSLSLPGNPVYTYAIDLRKCAASQQQQKAA